jgi:hypothetical protein
VLVIAELDVSQGSLLLDLQPGFEPDNHASHLLELSL